MAAAITELARAKVNLALHVLGRRADGYHELDSIVAFADLADRLTFAPGERFAFEVTGPFAADVPGGSDNLVLRALAALGAETKHTLPLRITLEKNIPVASGLGGGSADAAAALRGLVRLSGRKVESAALHAIAARIGADVPVCLACASSRMRGLGERIEAMRIAPMPAVLVNPRVTVATPWVFQALGLAPGGRAFDPIADAGDLASCRNDLTGPALSLAPVIAEVLESLASQQGTTLARMSGSGATCFALFPTEAQAQAAAAAIAHRHPHWWITTTCIGG